MMNIEFHKLAPYLSDPLILIGFFLLLAFTFSRYLIKKGVIGPMPKAQGYRILRLILLYGFIIALLIIIFGFALRHEALVRQQQTGKENTITPKPFSVDIKVAFSCSRAKDIGFWLAYKSKYGNTVSIIPLMLYMQITNLQSVPATINSLSLVIKPDKKDWQKVYAIHRPGSKVLFPIEGLHDVGRVTFDSGELLDLLNNRAILPHETVKGWILYYYPEDIIFPVQFCFYLVDTAKTEYSETIAMPKNDPDVLNNASINIAKEPENDVSKYRIIEYNESF
jgi:hypothetical protein